MRKKGTNLIPLKIRSIWNQSMTNDVVTQRIIIPFLKNDQKYLILLGDKKGLAHFAVYSIKSKGPQSPHINTFRNECRTCLR